ncbi:MAG: transcription-repair coupling factor [Gammaproteobacteria bacterium]|nr:transcription-repair coupling factor [Gammaproteobacteria bacterium]
MTSAKHSAIDNAASSDPFQPPLPQERGKSFRWGGLRGSCQGLVIASALRRHKVPLLLITSSMLEAERRERELRFFLDQAGDSARDVQVLLFPDRETLPYDVFSPHQDIISERLSTLHLLPSLRQGVVIVPVDTLMCRLPPRQFLDANCLMIDAGQTLDGDALRERLELSGYHHVGQVMEHGEYSIRGSIIDIYPMGSPKPYRIDLLDDEVDSIRTFDADDQRSIAQVDAIRLLPAREFPMTEASIEHFRQSWRDRFPGETKRCLIYTSVSEGQCPGGIEYYLPLFFDETATLFDYLPAHTVVINDADQARAAEQFWREITTRYESRRHDRERPLVSPEDGFVSPDRITALTKTHAFGTIEGFGIAAAEGHYQFGLQTLSLGALSSESADPVRKLVDFIRSFGGRILITVDGHGRRESLKERLREHGIHATDAAGWGSFVGDDAQLGIAIAHLEEGFILETPRIALITDALLFGVSVTQRRHKKRLRQRDADAIIRDLNELAIGAPVVHEEHGVGRYLGLVTLETSGYPTEFLQLEYAEGDKLYVPVASLQVISRYSGASPDQAPLHRLGGGQWQKAKRRAAQKASDVAAELLDIYARRQARQGYAYPGPGDEYATFAGAFPFEETPDQQQAIEQVIADMTTDTPMDRLVCGDVGFGKTEVAMRAAFMAVQGNKQVAVLVPTTLLAQQHYQNFCDRFAELPVRIEVLSRFRTGKQQVTTLDAIADGRVDIVIGTHKLIQPNIRFKRLGLVIIDEEHRFGVRQKERLKALRSEVDVLTLTATPIPRTLNMSIAGIRDLSIIATPPLRRLAIKTFVREWDAALLREACLREIHRGGQIYFLHNEVSDIERVANQLQEIVPEARIGIGHGQMPERELERVMLDFYHQRFNILLSTTIIESGIDIPNANTIIINRADRLGLAQLYQIRGRVGRSHHQAYAYLIAPPRSQMTADALKRLEAIESIEDLGAGFTLATHDLEIRGAGELLGDEQSGQIHEVGFSMYSQLLERAVAAIKSGRQPELDAPLHEEIDVKFDAPALIPEDYVPDVHIRLVMYKRVAGADSRDALDELQIEMIDRFGLLPEAAKMLFLAAELRLMAEKLGVKKIDAKGDDCHLTFSTPPKVDPFALIRLVQEQPRRYRLAGNDRLSIALSSSACHERGEEVRRILDEIMTSDDALQVVH